MTAEPAHGPADVSPRDVVQLDPAHHPGWRAGALMTVTAVRTWGVQGYVMVPINAEMQLAYTRAAWGSFVRVGRAVWVQEDT